MWHNNRYEHSNEIEKASLKSFGGGSGISENSRLAFGETIASHLKCELFSTTNKQKFHSQNEKKRRKTEEKKKDSELLSYHILIPVPVLNEKIKVCHSLLRKPPKLTS